MNSTTSESCTTDYQVTGMTCGHCASAVAKELFTIAGVSDVQVDLPTGQVTVCSDRPLDRDVVRAAIEEAGYQLA